MHSDVRERVLKIIRNITNIPPQQIGDDTSFRNQLNVDSLSMLEIGVDVGYEFRLEIADDYFKAVDTLAELVAHVEQAPRKPEAAT